MRQIKLKSLMSSPLSLAADFLKIAPQFRLGDLSTESRHPLTRNLSQLSQHDLEAGLGLLRDVEIGALDSAFAGKDADLQALTGEIHSTFSSGGRVFFGGCGATGRLSVSLEVLWRKDCAERGLWLESDRVRSFIAGGDYALVRSIENFEDHPEYGARQLREAGFAKNDLFIATTEGGETPFVIGAVLEAASIASRPPWFLFCNSVDSLMGLDRCRQVFANKDIRPLSLPTGPMALAGSTRLQASTVLMLACGACLFANQKSNKGNPIDHVSEFRLNLTAMDVLSLAPLIAREAEAYQKSRLCLHSADEYAITVLTDTTERSPTFSIAPFENEGSAGDRLALTYLLVPSCHQSDQAWKQILLRSPRALDWKSVAGQYDAGVMDGFNFSSQSLSRRSLRAGPPLIFSVESSESQLHLSIGGRSAMFPVVGSRLTEHLILKCAMNMTSTLVMGRLGRFESNLMLFVKPSNNKLIDRAIRSIRILLTDRGHEDISYEDVCAALFDVRSTLDPEDSIVLKTLETLTSRQIAQDRIA